MTDAVLSLNAGSSTLKFALFRADADVQPMARGQIEGIGSAPRLEARDNTGHVLTTRLWADASSATYEALLSELFGWVDAHLGGARLIAVGHRIVHGGASFTQPTLLDDEQLATLDGLSPLAPLHQPHNLAGVRAARLARPGLPQVGCFDTGFHSTQPHIATRFALPAALEAEGVRRYGFHGLSYEFIASRLAKLDPELARGRIIIAHLGAGASLCAIRAGESVDTTMGFTAVDGLMMATRCGALDPGVLLYLIQRHGYSGDQIEDLIYRQSGLLGVSGLSGDMRVLLASHDPRAKAAVALFVYRIGREAGALASSLGGLDGFVFTAGVGENSAEIRSAVSRRLAWLGVEIDEAANAAGERHFNSRGSAAKVLMVPTDEERMIAVHTLSWLAANES